MCSRAAQQSFVCVLKGCNIVADQNNSRIFGVDVASIRGALLQGCRGLSLSRCFAKIAVAMNRGKRQACKPVVTCKVNKSEAKFLNRTSFASEALLNPLIRFGKSLG